MPARRRAEALPLEPRMLLTTVITGNGSDDIDVSLVNGFVQITSSSQDTQSVPVAQFTGLELQDDGNGAGVDSDTLNIDLPGRTFTISASDPDPVEVNVVKGNFTVGNTLAVDTVTVEVNAALSVGVDANLTTMAINVASSYTQTGGSVVASSEFQVGSNVSVSSLDFSGGTLSAGAAFLGYCGQTNVTQSGGTMSFSTTQIGSYSTLSSSVNQTGGTFRSIDFWIGYYGKASYTLGAGATLSCSGEHFGSFGYSTFTNAGGSNDGIDGASGWEAGAHGGYSLYTQTAGSTLGGGVMGWWGGESTVNLSGGSFTCNGFNALGGWSDGNTGSGTFNQSGGTVHIFQLAIGYTGGTGVYNLSGGDLWTGFVNIGLSQDTVAGQGTFNQSGGHHYINWGGNGDTYATVPEVYNLDGGSLHGLLDPNHLAINITHATWTAGLIDNLTPVPDHVTDDATGVDVSASFTNSDSGPHYETSVIDWGDGAVEPLSVSVTPTGGTVAQTHVYTEPGLYHALLLVQDPFRSWEGGFAEAAFDVNVISDIRSVSYSNDTAQKVHVVFNERQSGVNAAWLLLHNLTTDTIYPAASQSFAWDSPTSASGTFSFGGLLPNGNYIATVGDPNHLDAESEAGIGEGDFFVLQGDVNHDRSVNAADQTIIQANVGLASATFNQGDLDYSGIVDSADLAIVQDKLGTSLALPPTPGTMTATLPTAGSFTLNWTATTGAQGYRIQMSTDGQTFRELHDVLDIGTTAYPVSGLAQGTRYWFRVRAFGNDHDTGYTPKVGATTIMPAPTNVTELQKDDGDIDVTWTDNSNDETGFTLTVTDGTDTQTYDLPPNDGSQDHYTLTGLDPSKDWSVSVAADGPAQKSASITYVWPYPMKTLLAPSNLTVSSTSDPTQLKLQWVNEESPNNVGGISIWVLASDGRFYGAPLLSSHATSYIYTGLTPGQNYEFAVQAVDRNSVGSAISRVASLGHAAITGEGILPKKSLASQLSNGYLKYGDDVAMTDVNTITLGQAGRSSSDIQVPEIRGYSIPIPLDGPDSITVAYDLHTWDSQGQETASWWTNDAFVASVSSLPYLQSPTAPPNVATASQFTWGGSKAYDQTILQSIDSSTTLEVPHDGQQYYLNLVLDTRNDGLLPSWGTFKFYAANIQVDSNNDGTISAADKQYAQQNPNGPGVIIPVNNDDDNDDGIPDDQEDGSVSEDNDLIPVKLSVWPEGVEGNVQFTAPSGGNVKFFQNADATGAITSGETWQTDQLPSQIYAEANAGSSALGDVAMALAMNAVDATAPAQATTRGTAEGAKITWVNDPDQPNADISGKKVNAIVGQLIDLSITRLGPAVAGSNYTWQVGGSRIANTVFDGLPMVGGLYATSGHVVPLEGNALKTQEIKFYFLHGSFTGDIAQVSSSIDGSEKLSGKTSFKVFQPDASLTGVGVNPVIDKYTSTDPDADSLFAEAEIDATLNVPTGFSGSYNWIQMVTAIDLRFRNAAGNWKKENISTGLDTTYPYNTAANGSGHSDNDPLIDVPGDPRMNSNPAHWTGYYYSAAFTSYLMFKPTGTDSIFVPLRKISWQVTMGAISNGTAWNLAGVDRTSMDQSDSEATSFPTWDHNVRTDIIEPTYTDCGSPF